MYSEPPFCPACVEFLVAEKLSVSESTHNKKAHDPHFLTWPGMLMLDLWIFWWENLWKNAKKVRWPEECVGSSEERWRDKLYALEQTQKVLAAAAVHKGLLGRMNYELLTRQIFSPYILLGECSHRNIFMKEVGFICSNEPFSYQKFSRSIHLSCKGDMFML